MEGVESIAHREQGHTTNEVGAWTERHNQTEAQRKLKREQQGEIGDGRCGWMERERKHISEHLIVLFLKILNLNVK